MQHVAAIVDEVVEEPAPTLADEYWAKAREPLACLLFLAPLIAMYEVGVVWLGGTDPSAIRNRADFWMRTCLERTGVCEGIVLPALLIGALLVWQFLGNYPWRASLDTLAGMLAESVLFAIGLLVIGQVHSLLFSTPTVMNQITPDGLSQAAQVIGFLGAGVYEETLFRLCLLPVIYALFRCLFLSPRPAAVMAIVATSLGFSMAHYIEPGSDPFSLFTFSFRALAGMFFAALFFARGFGITAGCHAAYDVLVGVLLLA